MYGTAAWTRNRSVSTTWPPTGGSSSTLELESAAAPITLLMNGTPEAKK
jgi:hypothetical protein